MRYVFVVLAVLFGGLHAFAVVTRLRKEKAGATNRLMLLGAVLVLISAVFNLMGNSLDWVDALSGSVIILAAAIKNGKDSGRFHLQHHIIRGVFALAIVIGFVLF